MPGGVIAGQAIKWRCRAYPPQYGDSMLLSLMGVQSIAIRKRVFLFKYTCKRSRYTAFTFLWNTILSGYGFLKRLNSLSSAYHLNA